MHVFTKGRPHKTVVPGKFRLVSFTRATVSPRYLLPNRKEDPRIVFYLLKSTECSIERAFAEAVMACRHFDLISSLSLPPYKIHTFKVSEISGKGMSHVMQKSLL